MVILDSARKHGYSDEDIYHAARNYMIGTDMDGYFMLVGPTTSGELIEVGVNRLDQIFHADRARAKYFPKQKR